MKKIIIGIVCFILAILSVYLFTYLLEVCSKKYDFANLLSGVITFIGLMISGIWLVGMEVDK